MSVILIFRSEATTSTTHVRGPFPNSKTAWAWFNQARPEERPPCDQIECRKLITPRWIRKTNCPDCRALLDSFNDIPETLKRTRAVWRTQACTGVHTLDAWAENPVGPPYE